MTMPQDLLLDTSDPPSPPKKCPFNFGSISISVGAGLLPKVRWRISQCFRRPGIWLTQLQNASRAHGYSNYAVVSKNEMSGQ